MRDISITYLTVKFVSKSWTLLDDRLVFISDIWSMIFMTILLENISNDLVTFSSWQSVLLWIWILFENTNYNYINYINLSQNLIEFYI